MKEGVIIPDGDLVTVTKMNHIVEVQHMQKMNRKAHIKKLDKDRYVDLQVVVRLESLTIMRKRHQSFNSMRQTFKKLRYLINNNFTGAGNELHVILTYAENMTDTKRLYKDYEKFIKRLRYKYKDISSIDYISVVEPQGRGAWHCHLLLRFNDIDKVYIENSMLAELWGHGFVTIRSLKDVDNIGAYLSAYLTDVELTEENIISLVDTDYVIVVKEVNGQEKNIVKGGRLHLYPSGMNLFRKSKGIVYPERQRMKYKEIKKLLVLQNQLMKSQLKLRMMIFTNTINYEQYNLKRL